MTDKNLELSSAFDDGGQFAWDNTSLNLFITCPRKYYLRMIEGWVPKRKSVHLLFGGWIADALEQFYKLKAEGMKHDEAVDVITKRLLDWTWMPGYLSGADAETKTNPQWDKGHPWESDHNQKTRDTLVRTFIWYAEHYREDNCEVVILNDGSPAVEHSFKLQIDDGYVWCGHIDRLVTYGSDVFVMDQKTTGSTIGPYWFDQWGTDGQMSGYTFAGQAIFNLPVAGVIIDGMQIAVGFTRFERGFTHRTQEQLEEWYDETLHWIGQARESFAEKYWPMNRSSCGNYGGCEFRDVCSRNPDVRTNFLKADFTDQGDQWNPLVER